MVTRFAPSPTGYLHLGHVVNAICVWRMAREAGGRVLLRMEDHDRIRFPARIRGGQSSRISSGLDSCQTKGCNHCCDRANRAHLYEEALTRLRATHHVYACDCSRKQIAGARYDGHCRDRQLTDGRGRGLRVRIDPGPERFDDLLLGPIEHTPAEQCGDLLVRDRNGHWTYQFAATVDDVLQGVTHVIRGADLLSSTARQVRLARMLGRHDMPVYFHHPLVLKPNGEKLSKSAADTGVRELRRAGMTAADVIDLAGQWTDPAFISSGCRREDGRRLG
jgi:glutamyl-tRNA synthetase/glutamyl-Q tRNA(Asp) synthetase